MESGKERNGRRTGKEINGKDWKGMHIRNENKRYGKKEGARSSKDRREALKGEEKRGKGQKERGKK